MRRSGNSLPSVRLSLAHGRLLCVARLPRRVPPRSSRASELAVVASLAAPHLRRLTVFHGRRFPILDDTPRAA